MGKYLRGPSAVLVVAGAPALRESVAAAVERRSFPSPVTSAAVRAAEATDHDPDVEAVTCGACGEALDRLAATEEIGCVVLDDALADPPVADCVAAITEEHPGLPVVVYAAAGDEALASATTRAGAFAYLPQPVGSVAVPDHGDLLDTVGEALTVHDRRYQAAVQSDVLDAMFADLEVPLYVKDDEARHLKMADATAPLTPRRPSGRPTGSCTPGTTNRSSK